MLSNVLIDIIDKDGKKTVHDVHLCSVDDLKDTLLDLNIESRFQAEIYVTDNVIKINVKG